MRTIRAEAGARATRLHEHAHIMNAVIVEGGNPDGGMHQLLMIMLSNNRSAFPPRADQGAPRVAAGKANARSNINPVYGHS